MSDEGGRTSPWPPPKEGGGVSDQTLEGGAGEEAVAEGEATVAMGHGVAKEGYFYLAAIKAATDKLKIETHHPTPLLWLADDDTLINKVVFGQVDTLLLEVMRHERRSKGEDGKEHGTALQTLMTA